MSSTTDKDRSKRASKQLRDRMGKFATPAQAKRINKSKAAAPAAKPKPTKKKTDVVIASVNKRIEKREQGGSKGERHDEEQWWAKPVSTPPKNTSRSDIIEGGPTGKMQVVVVGKTVCHIPIDSEGYVPHEYLIQRYFDVYKGKGKYRRPDIDSLKDANVIYKKDRYYPEDIAPWVANPHRYDIDGIDTIGSPRFITEYDAVRRDDITIANAIGNQDKIIKEHLEKNFYPRERSKMKAKGNKLMVFVAKPHKEAAGIYFPSNNAIYVDPNRLKEPDTVVHEAVHALRYNDKGRKGLVISTRITGNKLSDRDRTLEEAATEAETVTRITPFKYNNFSYYGDLPPKVLDADERIRKDRKLFTGRRDDRGLKGKAAIDTVEKNFSQSEISELKLKKSPETAKGYLSKLRGEV